MTLAGADDAPQRTSTTSQLVGGALLTALISLFLLVATNRLDDLRSEREDAREELRLATEVRADNEAIVRSLSTEPDPPRPFAGMDLAGGNLARLRMANATLTGADLFGSNLFRANLNGARLVNANLQLVNLQGTVMNRAVLNGAQLDAAFMRGTALCSARLTEATMYGVVATRADFRRADLKGARLGGAEFRHADLQGAILVDVETDRPPKDYIDRIWRTGAPPPRPSHSHDGVNLAHPHNGDLLDDVSRFTDFSHANLRGADLSGADLSRANLEGADLRDVVYDDETDWPAGFVPPPSARTRTTTIGCAPAEESSTPP